MLRALALVTALARAASPARAAAVPWLVGGPPPPFAGPLQVPSTPFLDVLPTNTTQVPGFEGTREPVLLPPQATADETASKLAGLGPGVRPNSCDPPPPRSRARRPAF